jgi:hypothetical protein
LETKKKLKELEDTKGVNKIHTSQKDRTTKTNNVMTKRKRTNGQTTVYNTLHRKSKIEQHKTHYKLTNNGLQYTTQKIKDRATQNTLQTDKQRSTTHYTENQRSSNTKHNTNRQTTFVLLDL